MKKLLEISGFLALALAIVVFVLMMATPAIVNKDATVVLVKGTEAIFGGKYIELAPLALLAWIFVLLAILVICVTVVLPLVKKVKGLEKFAGLLNVCACLLLIVAGIFMFCVRAHYDAAYIGAGWVIGGIIAFGAGALLILPAVLNFVKKK